MKELWTEKYRPKDVAGYVFRDNGQKQQVESWIKSKAIPHLFSAIGQENFFTDDAIIGSCF
mgnify:CR=1 FL=1